MTTEIKDIPLTDNKEEQRFEMNINGAIAFIAYEEHRGALALVHTEVPESLEGKGVGSVLALKTLEHLEAGGRKIIPLCPFVNSYIKRHPEWERIVS